MTLAILNKGAAMLARAETPDQTREIEAMARAAHAWAVEQDNYKMIVDAMRLYIEARRKTTELVLPFVKQGRHGKLDKHVQLLDDMGFTHKQWSRRVEELKIPPETLDEYFDDCILTGRNPSVYGLIQHVNDTRAEPTFEHLWSRLLHYAEAVGRHEQATPAQRRACKELLNP